MLKHPAIAAAFLLAAALRSASARGDDLPPDVPKEGVRTLQGHTFLFPVTHAGSFVATYFGVAQGVYNEHIPNVPVPIGRNPDLNLIGYTTSANLGVKLTDWLGVQVTGTALAVAGLDGESVIYAGGNLNAGGNVAPIVRIFRNERTGTQVSARAQIGWLSGATLDLPRLLVLARSTIAEADDPATAASVIGRGLISGGLTRVVISGIDTFGLLGSIEAAQALGPMFGLQGAASFERRVNGITLRNPITGTFRDSATRYDALFDLSFEWDGASAHVPIAAILEYELNARITGSGNEHLEQDSKAVHTLGVGVYYSGRPNLQVGLFGATLRNLRSVPGVGGTSGYSESPSAQYAEMLIRYVW